MQLLTRQANTENVEKYSPLVCPRNQRDEKVNTEKQKCAPAALSLIEQESLALPERWVNMGVKWHSHSVQSWTNRNVSAQLQRFSQGAHVNGCVCGREAQKYSPYPPLLPKCGPYLRPSRLFSVSSATVFWRRCCSRHPMKASFPGSCSRACHSCR